MEEVLSQYQHYQQSQALQSAMDQQKQQNLLKQKAKNKTEIFHLLLNHNLKDLEIATFIEQMLEEKMITYQYSAKTLTNSILWLQAKPNPNYSEGLQQNNMTQSNGFSFNLAQQQQMQMQQMAAQYKYDNEFAMVYHNVDTFQQDYKRGYLQQEMQRLMKYKQMRISQGSNGFKVIVLFHGVYDSLFNNEPLGQETQGVKHNQFKDQTKKEQLRQDCMTGDLTVSKSEYDKFLIDLTITYQFDYIQLDSPIEVIEFLKEMHQSIVEKPHRKELSMYSRKGFKPGKKASMCGFKDPQSINYISMLMCIPGQLNGDVDE
eukprot:403372839